MKDEYNSVQREWLEKNHKQFRWRLIGPNFRNRFDSSVSQSKLEEFIREKELLWENCSVQ